MLGARDNETHSYLEVVDVLRQHGASVQADLEELWRRIVFYILISNTDDHLRNLGFLYQGLDGWRLAPAYDLNPVPVEVKPRILTTNITWDDGTAKLDRAMEVADYFKLSKSRAHGIVSQIGKAVAGWRKEATKFGIEKSEQEVMASAFEHDDLHEATR
jgi:serine/threonine-protein kinase HipA